MKEKEFKMVDIGSKNETERIAEAVGKIKLSEKTIESIIKNQIPKGNVLSAAQLAGITAAKKAHELIPLCHPLRITSVELEINPDFDNKCISIKSKVKAFDRTGVEMEALTAVIGAVLTIYDMCKGIDKRMVIDDIHLLSKKGGRSGKFKW
ncbi:cyclic pyranopterin monophosphate synthase MoaC [Candidatus Aminicenantes bacterium AH-873-B07]|jgi:cyclic pyranopterin phosphate synthase|nr:cyclic pyranopterin monophosphate synthase MoaC [Candidatus Aminicenantes bacterium AH-873-B07]